MDGIHREKYLRIALVLVGILFIFGLYPLINLWQSGWRWQPVQYEFEYMMLGVYGTLGVFLLIASRNPKAHKSLIWFTVWSSIVHGAIMGVEAVIDPAERGHLVGDVPALFIVAILLALLMPRGKGTET
jgi:hypothetical protein